MPHRYTRRQTATPQATIGTWNRRTAEASRVYGLTGFDMTNILATAAGAGLVGHTTLGFWARVLVVFAQVPNASRHIVHTTNAAQTNGYTLDCANTGTVFANTAGTPAFSPTSAIAADDIGKLLDFWLVWDSSANLLRLYRQGAQVGAGSAESTIVLSTGPTAMGVKGTVAFAAPFDQGSICAIEGGDGSFPDGAEIAAAYAATQARVAAGQSPYAGVAGKTTHRWQVGQVWSGTLTDEVGAANMTMIAGASSGLDLVSFAGPQWA